MGGDNQPLLVAFGVVGLLGTAVLLTPWLHRTLRRRVRRWYHRRRRAP